LQIQPLRQIFQFQYGSIKSTGKDGEQVDVIIFQFQYGSIKSLFLKCLSKELPKFQFQYGSIKSDFSLGIPSPFSYFNSNMVRLKVSYVAIVKSAEGISIPIWFD